MPKPDATAPAAAHSAPSRPNPLPAGRQTMADPEPTCGPRPARDPRRRWIPDLAWAVPPALWLAATTFANHQMDPTEAAETRFLSLMATGVVAAIVAIESGGRRAMASASTSTALGVITVLWVLHHGAHRGMLTIGLLAAGLATALAKAIRRHGVTPAVAIPGALGLQLLVRPDLLLPPLVDLRTLVSVLVLPTLVGLALAALATVWGSRRTVLAATGAAMLAPGWNVVVTLSCVAAAAATLPLSSFRRWLLALLGIVVTVVGVGLAGDIQGAAAGVVVLALCSPERGALATVIGRVAGVGLALVVWLAAYPWCRADPLLSILERTRSHGLWLAVAVGLVVLALIAIDRYAAAPWSARAATWSSALLVLAVALHLPRPIEVAFSGPPPRVLERRALKLPIAPATRQIVIDTDLVHGDRVAADTVVAQVFLVDTDGRDKARWPVRAGRHTADWAAGRADLAGLTAPRPWLRGMAPSGQFFAQRYRRELFIETDDSVPEAGDRIVIRRAPRLDPEVQIRVHRVEWWP